MYLVKAYMPQIKNFVRMCAIYVLGMGEVIGIQILVEAVRASSEVEPDRQAI